MLQSKLLFRILPIFGRRATRFMLEIPAEEGIGGEIEGISNFAYRHVCSAEQGFRLNDDPLLNMFHGKFPRGLTHQL